MENDQEKEMGSEVIVLDDIGDIAKQSEEKIDLGAKANWIDEKKIGGKINLFGFVQLTVVASEKTEISVEVQRCKKNSPAENFFVGGGKCQK